MRPHREGAPRPSPICDPFARRGDGRLLPPPRDRSGEDQPRGFPAPGGGRGGPGHGRRGRGAAVRGSRGGGDDRVPLRDGDLPGGPHARVPSPGRPVATRPADGDPQPAEPDPTGVRHPRGGGRGGRSDDRRHRGGPVVPHLSYPEARGRGRCRACGPPEPQVRGGRPPGTPHLATRALPEDPGLGRGPGPYHQRGVDPQVRRGSRPRHEHGGASRTAGPRAA